MTIQLDGMDLVAAAQAATVVAGIVSMLVIGLLIYWLVRPPRHVREARRSPAPLQESEAEQMIALMERMEARLDVLERLVVEPAERPLVAEAQKILEPAGESREIRRTK